jgi:hypothetical protein
MEQNENEKNTYESKQEYSKINKDIVSALQEEKETKQNITYYTVNVNYYNEYEMYYLVIPQDYLNQIDTLRLNKEDIFAKGKILTFSDEHSQFYFDAVIDSTEENIYAYFVPIKEKYRRSYNLCGYYNV